MSSREFPEALRDYKYLLDRGYDRSKVLDLVVERYGLGREARDILLRTVFASRDVEERIGKRVEVGELEGERVAVDGYNVLSTITSSLLGYPLFLALDGFVRDISSLVGKLTKHHAIYTSLVILLVTLSRLRPKRVEVFYDAQVSKSGLLALYTRTAMRKIGIEGRAYAVRRADKATLLSGGGVVASSDSVVISRARRVADLAGYIAMGIAPESVVDLRKLLRESLDAPRQI